VYKQIENHCIVQYLYPAIEKVLTKGKLEKYSRSLVLLIHLRDANELLHSSRVYPEYIHVASQKVSLGSGSFLCAMETFSFD